ncbi:hypothetical protein CQA57_05695 [Helicobacter anseris]|uniref:Uncharacterized protein n=1 Tax=Helicobacter anseris TaxID=375926 RepID=A0A3D8J6D5_9HELI|nr:hypothetical protein [Helicobacter anseris]RDU73018.1 hypothetical protein CQA57_05695 [Helicobacter anseris]
MKISSFINKTSILSFTLGSFISGYAIYSMYQKYCDQILLESNIEIKKMQEELDSQKNSLLEKEKNVEATLQEKINQQQNSFSDKDNLLKAYIKAFSLNELLDKLLDLKFEIEKEYDNAVKEIENSSSFSKLGKTSDFLEQIKQENSVKQRGIEDSIRIVKEIKERRSNNSISQEGNEQKAQDLKIND